MTINPASLRSNERVCDECGGEPDPEGEICPGCDNTRVQVTEHRQSKNHDARTVIDGLIDSAREKITRILHESDRDCRAMRDQRDGAREAFRMAMRLYNVEKAEHEATIARHKAFIEKQIEMEGGGK